MSERTPAAAWAEMMSGNERFVSGTPLHPRQNVEHRAAIAPKQSPEVALFGCSDSRLAAEIIFDKGLGDLFVIRNAGQIISDSVVGSIEYAVAVLNVPLIVVLGHDECGAVAAAIAAAGDDAPPLPAHIAHLIEDIVPAVHRVETLYGHRDPQAVGREHLRNTIAELLETSELISAAVAAGTLAVVGANYRLLEGRVIPDVIVGAIYTQPADPEQSRKTVAQ